MRSLLKSLFYHPWWGKRFCIHPFTRLEIGDSKQFVPCCEDWFTEEYKKLPHVNHWNGLQALKLRNAHLQGDFSYCKTNECSARTYTWLQVVLLKLLPFLHKKAFPFGVPSWSLIRSLLFKKAHLKQGPLSVNLVADVSCNLACPSCRATHVPTVPEEILDDAKSRLQEWKHSLQSLLFSGGEVFFSKWSKEILQNFNRKDFPNLKQVHLMTNGLLCTPKQFEKLKPGIDYVKTLSLSMDAASELMYAKTRGGNWKRLIKNLEFISELRRKKKITKLNFCFVVRRENYKEMQAFVSLARRYHADRVLFQTYQVWPGSQLNYQEEAVHLETHPEYQQFKEIKDEVLQDPNVTVSI